MNLTQETKRIATLTHCRSILEAMGLKELNKCYAVLLRSLAEQVENDKDETSSNDVDVLVPDVIGKDSTSSRDILELTPAAKRAVRKKPTATLAQIDEILQKN